jgi:hypothetical protein
MTIRTPFLFAVAFTALVVIAYATAALSASLTAVTFPTY